MLEPDRDTEVKHAVADKTDVRKTFSSWICRVYHAEAGNQPVLITGKGIIVGASPSCDVVVDDAAVSARHLRLMTVPNGILIEDLGSTNGTFLRTTRIDKVVLTNQCQVLIGNTALEIAPSGQIDVTPSDSTHFGSLVGRSVTMRKCFAIMALAAKSDVTVVIEGESGTGKELAARAIHEQSQRTNQPFVVVDCAGIPEQLIESHLFGHRQGAFTGAVESRKGAFALADGGTIFLDELGELPLLAQGKLLRALEAQTIQPVGAERPVHVDVRVIAATNRNLEQMVAEDKFRFDLFHRLSVLRFQMPALRDHLDDIPTLIDHFYQSRNTAPGDIRGEGLRHLMAYDWPGNVRELRNVLERAWVLSGLSNPPFHQLHFAFHHQLNAAATPVVDTSVPFKEAKEKWLSTFETEYVQSIIRESDGNISKAAAHAGLNRNHVRRLMEKYGLIK